MPTGPDLFAVNLYVGLAAPLIGSAAAAASVRLAGDRTWNMSPSACLSCGRKLGVLELVPILSWLAQCGRCRGCSSRVSSSYPVIELAAVVVAVWAWLATPPQFFAVTCVFGWLLLTLSAIDFRTYRLPDLLTGGLFVCGLGTLVLFYPQRAGEHLMGAALGFASLLAVAFAYRLLRCRDGLGRGDAKLLGAIGVWIGPSGLPWCIFLSASLAIVSVLIIGRITRRRIAGDTMIPFGPFLAVGGWVVWVNGALAF